MDKNSEADKYTGCTIAELEPNVRDIMRFRSMFAHRPVADMEGGRIKEKEKEKKQETEEEKIFKLPNSFEKSLELVRMDGMNIRHIDEKFMNNYICDLAVKKTGYALQFIPKKYRNYQLYMDAVKKNGCALEFVDEEDQTSEMIKEAIKQNGLALRFIKGKNKIEYDDIIT